MKTRAWMLAVAVAVTGWETFALGSDKPTGPGADSAGKPEAGDKNQASAPGVSPGKPAAGGDTSVVDGFWEDFAYVKKVEEMVKKAERRVEELERAKEFLQPGALEMAKREAKWWRDEYCEALDAVADYGGVWLFLRPGVGNSALGEAITKANETDKVKETKRDEDAAGRAADQAETDEKELIKKADDLAAAGKTKEAKEVRDRIPAATQKADQADKAAHKAYDDHNQALFDALKRAEAAGKLPPPSNERFKAIPKLSFENPLRSPILGGGSDYVPGPGSGPTGLKTPLDLDFSGSGQNNAGMQGTNPLQPRIFYLPAPRLDPGWSGTGGYGMPFPGGKGTDKPAPAHPAGCTCKQCTGK